MFPPSLSLFFTTSLSLSFSLFLIIPFLSSPLTLIIFHLSIFLASRFLSLYLSLFRSLSFSLSPSLSSGFFVFEKNGTGVFCAIFIFTRKRDSNEFVHRIRPSTTSCNPRRVVRLFDSFESLSSIE